MIFIYRATRIFIKFYSKTFGRVTAAHWKWVKICTFALSVPPVCTEILSYLLQLNFSPSRSYFLKKFAVRAHIRIFLAFRICINFYPILEIELARPNLPPKIWGHSQGKKLSVFAIFCGSKPDTFYILSICDLKESSEPILPLWGHERPLTRLSKDTLTFDLGPTVWAHKAGAFSARKLYGGRKYIFFNYVKNESALELTI